MTSALVLILVSLFLLEETPWEWRHPQFFGFKNKTYYTTPTIENCAKEQLGLQGWGGIWE